MEGKLLERVEQAIVDRVFPGCVVGVVDSNGKRNLHAFGHFTYEGNSNLVCEDTIYDVASITKAIPTASLALTLIAQGKLGLDEKVVTYLPDLQSDYGATIEDLLRYRVAGVRLSGLKNKTAAQITEEVFARGFDGPPSESRYSNLPALLLGFILEKVGGDPLDLLAQKYFFNPLDMHRTSFWPQFFSREEIAPTEIEEWRGHVQGSVHDESAYVYTVLGPRAVGHAGIFSTVPDLLNFLEALLQGKFLQVLKAAEQGLGWQIEGPCLGSKPQRRFGKTGFTGTSVVCDIERGIGLVILSNRTYPTRPPDQSAINSLRCDIAEAVFASN